MRQIVLGALIALVAGTASAAETAVPTTYGDAMRWYRAAAESNDPSAQYLLGYKLEIGEGAKSDPLGAREWYSRAALQGEPRALYRLGLMYHTGSGGDIDMAAAARLYRAAAERNHRTAQSATGYFYALGEGTERDDVQAFLWLSLAARAGDAAAADNLALLTPQLSGEQRAAGEALLEDWAPLP